MRKGWKRPTAAHRLAAALSLLAALVVLVALGGCGDDDSGSGGTAERLPVPADSRALDRRVATLEEGVAPAKVRARLGEPSEQSVFEDRSVEMLFYGRWQVVFEDGRLVQRTKWNVGDRPLAGAEALEREDRALDRRVMGLERGSTTAAVTKALGAPDVLSLDGDGRRRREVYTYGLWSLVFVGDRLKSMSKR